MADAKHTPGPWRVHKRKDEDEGTLVVTDNHKNVADSSSFLMGTAIGEDAANARLIAAAPDMYDACRIMDEAVREGHESAPALIAHMMEAATAARAALAKAEGA